MPRARANLGRDVLVEYDFISVAGTSHLESESVQVVSAELHGCSIAIAVDAEEDWKLYWMNRLKLVRAATAGIPDASESALARPRLKDASSVGYCVFCRAEYTLISATTCEDCGVPVVQIERPGPGESTSR
jgi:hypothetical protein